MVKGVAGEVDTPFNRLFRQRAEQTGIIKAQVRLLDGFCRAKARVLYTAVTYQPGLPGVSPNSPLWRTLFDCVCSVAAAEHGQVRRAQGYSAAMLIEESRVFQVATFGALHLHQSELDPNHLLTAAMVIADEVDAQLREAVLSWTAAA
jgi:hypothetical protein